MMDGLGQVEPHWAWLSLGVLLVALEILAPGYFLIWLGLAAVATGVAAWLLDISIPLQLGLFAVLAFAVLYWARRWLAKNPITSADPLMNQRTGRLVGDVVTLVQAIENGRGRARVGDSVWTVRGDDAPEGAKVRIIGADGNVLLVERIG